ncbi:MAG TPA: ribosome biogenesis GTPase Der [Candidatus Jacksonbacteria bacterium]|nr:ribosome biogenesis GTPase Der [Candidatus Jacksonbacteria bacterium]
MIAPDLWQVNARNNTLVMKHTLPHVILAGRSNVGKSTLFNRLCEEPTAVISPIAGTTRDRNEREIAWRGVSLILVDTAGLDIPQEQPINKKVIDQTNVALKHATIILFVVDVKSGVTPSDKSALTLLRTYKKPILLVANKADNQTLRNDANECYTLGCGDPLPVSATNGSGSGDLLDSIVESLPKKTFHETINSDILLAIIGQPNVGKSSIVNSILGEERVIVSDIPHTTRDPIDTHLVYKGQTITLIDTAGLRRPVKIEKQTIEHASTHKTITRIKRATVIGLVIDVAQEITRQDMRLGNLLAAEQKSAMIIANKWDMIPDKTTTTINQYEQYIYAKLGMLKYAPIIFTSAIDNQRTHSLLNTALLIHNEQKKSIDDETLRVFLEDTTRRLKPTRGKGTRFPIIYSLKQEAINPPFFKMITKPRTDIQQSYVSFIERRLREEFGFVGVPIKLVIEKGKD